MVLVVHFCGTVMIPPFGPDVRLEDILKTCGHSEEEHRGAKPPRLNCNVLAMTSRHCHCLAFNVCFCCTDWAHPDVFTVPRFDGRQKGSEKIATMM